MDNTLLPELNIHLGRSNNKKLTDAFQKWCEDTMQDFPKPSYGVFTDLRISDGSMRVFFLDSKETDTLFKCVRRIMKDRRLAK